MRVLVACEFSGIVRDAFIKAGHEAISCDLLPTDSPGPHYQGDIFQLLKEDNNFDLMIAHPPCTYLTTTANKYFMGNPDRWKKRYEAMLFVWDLMQVPIPRIAIENPIGVISSYIRKPEQIIHPYYFGDPVPKRTGLWLKNLPLLEYDDSTTVEPEYLEYNCKKAKNGKSRYGLYGKLGKGCGHQRSVFFPGIARAMALQWGKLIKEKNEATD